MTVHEAEYTPPRSGSTRCCICKCEIRRPMLIIHGLTFCAEHKRIFKGRRSKGVSTANLSKQWGDTLDNWSERPAELDQETGRRKRSTSFYLEEREGSWLLFMRGYLMPATGRDILRELGRALFKRSSRGGTSYAVFKTGSKQRRKKPRGSRFSDGLAFNTQTGEVRRFVDVSRDEVLDELRGVRAVEGQEEVAIYWGNYAPTRRHESLRAQFERSFTSENQRTRIPELLQVVAFPVYGPVGNPLDLTLCALGRSQGARLNQITSLGLDFTSERYPQSRNNFTVNSADANERGGIHNPRHIPGHPHLDLDVSLFRQYQLTQAEQEQMGSPTIWEGELSIAGKVFVGEVRSWSQPYTLTRFSLQNELTVLNGHACGPTGDKLFQVLEGLQNINQQGELLAQYQRELDLEIQRLRARFY